MINLDTLVSRVCRTHCWIKNANGAPGHRNEPLDDEKLKLHLAKERVYGVCPINPGEDTCSVALLDLDSHKGETPWEDMVEIADELTKVAALMGLTAVPYRSSGGQGIHLYFLWPTPQDARSVRIALNTLLGQLGYENGDGGVVNKQIEIFPKQDRVPHDGYGNMFWLPGAGKSIALNSDGWVMSENVRVIPHGEKNERQKEKPRDDASRTQVPGDGSQSGPDAQQLQLIRSALAAIPNDPEHALPYSEWVRIVHAVHAATDGSDAGLALVSEWSGRSGKHDPAFLESRVWAVAGKREDGLITVKTLYHAARQHGWRDDLVTGFDDLRGAAVAEQPTAAAGNRPGKFRAQRLDEFLLRPPARWLIKKFLPQAGLAILYGESGSGKSFFALDLGCAIARGSEWRGIDVPRGRVVYICAEGAGGFLNRVRAYTAHTGCALHEIDLQVIPERPNFLSATDITAVVESIRDGGPCSLVIVDTLAQVTAGSNENSGEDMGVVLANCDTIHKVTGAMVMLVHHAGKDTAKGARGWSGINGASDVTIEITRDDMRREATVRKMKDGEDGARYGFELENVFVDLDEDQEAIGSCVVVATEASKMGLAKTKKNGRPALNEDRVLSVLVDMAGTNGTDKVPYGALIERAKEELEQAEGGRDTRRQRAIVAVQKLASKGFVESNDGFVTLVNVQKVAS